MPPVLPHIDDRNYENLLDELVAMIPVETPEWADFNENDPGITLVGFFAFLAESLLWQIDKRERQRRNRRLALLVVGTAGFSALWLTSRLSSSRSCPSGDARGN